jgi:2-desacetyl-2-hydroxyethyl bacteriochlorophyllide A dehydrogenase
MRAAIFEKAGEPFAIREVPDPSPGEGEVVLRVSRCGICGSDVHMTAADGYGFPAGSVLGHEFCGEVVALGRGVSDVRLGDRLTAMPFIGCRRCDACARGEPGWCQASPRAAGFGTAMGAYSEFVAVSAASSVPLPDGVTDELGALVEPLAVALHGVRRASVTTGVRVAVLGAGPIGLGVALWARRSGAEQIAVVARSRRNAEIAERMGASAFLTDPASVADALGGHPEVVFECVGKPGLLDKALEIVAPRGRVVVLGFCTQPDLLNAAGCLLKEVTIGYSKTYNLADYVDVVAALGAGETSPREMISRTVSLMELPASIEAIRSGLPDCKIQIDPWAPDRS